MQKSKTIPERKSRWLLPILFFMRFCHICSLYLLHFRTTTVNGVYVDGVSITLGEPCKHVWTYAIGLNDDFTNGSASSYGFGYFHCN